jgi:hypothetical protein
MRLKAPYALATLVALWVLFQVFFRYQYVSAANFVWRIDRLTGASCELNYGCDYYWALGPRPASGAPPGFAPAPQASSPP